MKSKNNIEKVKKTFSFTIRWPIDWRFSSRKADRFDALLPVDTDKNFVLPLERIYGKSRLPKIVPVQKKTADHLPLAPLNKTPTSTEYRHVTSPSFSLCGYKWAVLLTPGEFVDDTLAMYLVYLGCDDIVAAYSFAIKDQRCDGEGDHFQWSDPDGPVLFSSAASGDNQWGADDLVSLRDLGSHPGWTLGGQLCVEVEVEVHREESVAYTPGGLDAAAREEGASPDQSQLIAQAQEEVTAVRRQLSRGRDVDQQKAQEDRILRDRLRQLQPTTTAPPSRSSRGSSRK